MRILGLIPARGGSKRIPHKNLALLGGRPLVLHAMLALRQSRRVAARRISTDCPEIARVCRPLMSVLMRPAELATDDTPMLAVVRHALETLGNYDAVAVIPPSAPLTVARDIDGTIELWEESGAESAASVMRVPHAYHPIKAKRLIGSALQPYWEPESNRWTAEQLPAVYVRNCAVYVTRLSAIERGQLVSEDCVGYVMPAERSVDINEPIDLELARLLWQQRR
jgi:CMP-N-acetylneuraminic acid synthetase